MWQDKENDALFEEVFRQKLKDYEGPVREELWQGISKNISKAGNPKDREAGLWIGAAFLLFLTSGVVAIFTNPSGNGNSELIGSAARTSINTERVIGKPEIFQPANNEESLAANASANNQGTTVNSSPNTSGEGTGLSSLSGLSSPSTSEANPSSAKGKASNPANLATSTNSNTSEASANKATANFGSTTNNNVNSSTLEAKSNNTSTNKAAAISANSSDNIALAKAEKTTSEGITSKGAKGFSDKISNIKNATTTNSTPSLTAETGSKRANRGKTSSRNKAGSRGTSIIERQKAADLLSNEYLLSSAEAGNANTSGLSTSVAPSGMVAMPTKKPISPNGLGSYENNLKGAELQKVNQDPFIDKPSFFRLRDVEFFAGGFANSNNIIGSETGDWHTRGIDNSKTQWQNRMNIRLGGKAHWGNDVFQLGAQLGIFQLRNEVGLTGYHYAPSELSARPLGDGALALAPIYNREYRQYRWSSLYAEAGLNFRMFPFGQQLIYFNTGITGLMKIGATEVGLGEWKQGLDNPNFLYQAQLGLGLNKQISNQWYLWAEPSIMASPQNTVLNVPFRVQSYQFGIQTGLRYRFQ